MSKTISVEAANAAMALYEQACLNYFRTPCKELFDRAVEAERICAKQNIRRSELTKIRLMTMHAVEDETK